MFSLAVAWGWRTDNPARGVRRFPEEKRTRWLQTDELERLARALDEFAAPRARKSKKPADAPDGEMPTNIARMRSADAIRLLLLTGARASEVLSAKWSHIDFARAVWTKPSAHTTQKRTEHVPLSPPALALLQSIKDAAPKIEAIPGPYIFPGDSQGKPLQGIKRAWATICRAAKLDPMPANGGNTDDDTQNGKRRKRQRRTAGAVRLHDLRHTYAHLVSSGLALPLIGKLLRHTQAATTQRYAHLADDPLREATGRIGALYEAVQRQRPSAKVVRLHGAEGDTA